MMAGGVWGRAEKLGWWSQTGKARSLRWAPQAGDQPLVTLDSSLDLYELLLPPLSTEHPSSIQLSGSL